MSKFELSIIVVDDLKRSSELNQPQYDPEYDDINSVLTDLCDTLSEAGVIQFKVSGFGQVSWPVDVSTDLLCVLEQLGNIIQFLAQEKFDFTLDFFEQGLERRLEFSDTNSLVEVICRSATEWQPNPDKVKIEKNEVKSMFVTLKADFCFVVHKVFPEISKHPWFVEWEMNSA